MPPPDEDDCLYAPPTTIIVAPDAPGPPPGPVYVTPALSFPDPSEIMIPGQANVSVVTPQPPLRESPGTSPPAARAAFLDIERAWTIKNLFATGANKTVYVSYTLRRLQGRGGSDKRTLRPNAAGRVTTQ